ncbi:ABC transporter substrate-binding protein [Amycolatopsis magusensis]|uniref:ABC transporter substrate-binding protein n=1 Tax=Amycolatopsis magusensis TaxID=882444 RepID=UPI0024A9D8B7|nr:peptide ABC transporter substrate-binding protein [Amycolatopsis magusensis]MDI5976580.1 peptide ABC transporter substrate-binding protein [Amycolatopsis magusensis]
MRAVRSTWRRRAAALGATALVAAAPVLAIGPAQAQQPTVLRVALVQSIDHLNPFTASFASTAMIGRISWEFLTLPSAEDNLPTPGLAETWTPSPDGLTWTFKIREAKWSDGTPLTAKDAAFTFNRMMSDPAAREANGTFVEQFQTVTATDDRTLTVTLKKPQASMTALDVPIVPEHIWSGVTDMASPETDTVAKVGVGSGPFTITEYQTNQLVRMKANPNYWRGAPKVDELQFVKFDNADAAVNALKNGEVDLINRLTSTQFDALNGQPGITTNKAVGRRYDELLINPGAQNFDRQPIGDGHPALKDVRVRKAIARAIDPATIIDKVLGGYGEAPGGIVPPMFKTYHYAPGPAEKYTFDLAAANAALDQAGYPKGPDGIRVAPDGRKLEFRFTGHATRDYDQRVVKYVAGWLGEIGIKITEVLVSDNEVDESTSAGNYDLALSGWGTNPDPDYILAKQTCSVLPATAGSTSSNAFFCDAEYDRLYALQAAEPDIAKRAEYAKQAQARYYDQVPSVVLDYKSALEAYRSDKFSGLTRQPVSGGALMEQSGYWSFYGAVPAGEDAAAAGDSGGLPTVAWIAIGAGAVILVVLIGVVVSRRGKSAGSADDKE